MSKKYFKAEIVIEVDDHWVDWDSEDEVEWLMSGLKQKVYCTDDTCEVFFYAKDLEDYMPCQVLSVKEMEDYE